MRIEDRVALVTGGARRVGRALSLGLARAGAHIIVNHHRSDREAAETVAEIESLGRRAVAVKADVSRAEERAHLLDEAQRAFGALDILVNNASSFERARFAELEEADFDRVMGVNLKAPFFLSQAAAPLLSAGGGGLIVNLLDLSIHQVWPSYAHHAVSKAGLAHLTRVLARVLAPAIRVNGIAPGNVLPPEDFDGQDLASGSDRRVLERSGRAEDVVDALLWLAGADFVTGQILIVDGGRMLL